MTRNQGRAVRALASALVGVALLATPVLAHVGINPGEAVKGEFATLTFRVPNERSDSGTVRVDVGFPDDHPIGEVTVEDRPGWAHTIDRDGAGVVTRIAWEGGPIPSGGVEEFEVTVGPLPDDTDLLIFKALQTYDNGEVVRWINEPGDGGDGGDRPAPVLRLVDAGDAGQAPTATTTSHSSDEHGNDDHGTTTVPADADVAESVSVTAETSTTVTLDDTETAAGDDTDTETAASDDTDTESQSNAIGMGIGIAVLGLVIGGLALLLIRRS